MEKYKRLARDFSLRLTPQRLAVLRFLDGNTAHPSADDVYRAVLRSFPTTSLATVYNTLNTLKEAGEVTELSIDPERGRFDPNTAPHHHLMCIECKRIVDVHKRYQLDLSGAEAQGFEVTEHCINFYGVCPSCKAKEDKDKGKA